MYAYIYVEREIEEGKSESEPLPPAPSGGCSPPYLLRAQISFMGREGEKERGKCRLPALQILERSPRFHHIDRAVLLQTSHT